jgi:glycosyltransferase involved in cell wall biosynthesis
MVLRMTPATTMRPGSNRTEHAAPLVRVLLQGRSARSIAANPGGDQVQLEATARALRANGVDAQISAEAEPNLFGFDAVHLFGLVRPQETWIQAKNAIRQGKPVFLSTVYCDVWEFEQVARSGPVGWIARRSNRNVMEALKAAGRGVNNREWSRGSLALFLRGYSRMQRELVSMSSSFLPNSRSEWLRIAHDLRLNPDDGRVTVVPNGFDADESSMVGGSPPAHLAKFDGCVLCVARLEGRKNQANLIEAVRDTDLPLVLAGPATANQGRYVKRVEEAAGSLENVYVLGAVTAEEKAWLYSLAQVHVLPSWMETCGLSSLEAAVAGCAVVVSPNGDTHDYFGDYADYCDPASPASIREAIIRAKARGPSAALVERVCSEFTWERCGEATYRAYRDVLA